jgi:hypothetical protein
MDHLLIGSDELAVRRGIGKYVAGIMQKRSVGLAPTLPNRGFVPRHERRLVERTTVLPLRDMSAPVKWADGQGGS